MSIQDEYAKRIDSYDRVLHEAREAHRKALAWGRVHTPHWGAEYDQAGQRYQDSHDAAELGNQENILGWMANHRDTRPAPFSREWAKRARASDAACTLTPAQVAKARAQAARETAQAWERELATQDARARYGLTSLPHKELTVRHDDNVITVDFRGRTRAPRTNRRPRG